MEYERSPRLLSVLVLLSVVSLLLLLDLGELEAMLVMLVEEGERDNEAAAESSDTKPKFLSKATLISTTLSGWIQKIEDEEIAVTISQSNFTRVSLVEYCEGAVREM